MQVVEDLQKSIQFIVDPECAFENEMGRNEYWPMVRFFLVLNVFLALLTPVVNWFHIPSDIIHAGTNAQMGAFVQAPLLESSTGISRYFWVAILTYFGNFLKFPLLGVLFHGFAKIMRGAGSLNDSFKVSIYSTAPVLLLGWIPYFGLISGLWVGYLYVVGFWKLHGVTMGKAIALVNLLIGIQLVWALVFGWLGSSIPW
jgi:hypothetical protein